MRENEPFFLCSCGKPLFLHFHARGVSGLQPTSPRWCVQAACSAPCMRVVAPDEHLQLLQDTCVRNCCSLRSSGD